MRAIFLITFFGVAATVIPTSAQMISGGKLTNIEMYPEIASILSWDLFIFEQLLCSGVILNSRSILTAGHCVGGRSALNLRVRVGSSFPRSGGVVHRVSQIILHEDYLVNQSEDIGILRIASEIDFSNAVRPAKIAGATYIPADNEVVLTAGWGTHSILEEQLRHVQMWTINQEVCKARYQEVKTDISDNMMCAGWLDASIRDQWSGGSGSPTFHKGTVVGILSFLYQYGNTYFPIVSTRVNSFVSWIQANS